MSFSKAPLESLCELIVDCPHSTPKWTESGVVVLRNQNIRNGRLDLSNPSFTDETHYEERVRRAVPQHGDLVFTREAPMGEVCRIPEGVRCCLGQRQVLLRVNGDNDARFVLYAIQSPIVQNEIGWNEGTGSTVSNVRIPVLKALNIPRPPLREQQEISATLGLIDDKIELNGQIARTLEELAQSLFKSWFVDFDPVRAKMAGRQPAHTHPEIANLFPDRVVESPLGPVPAGWTVSELGDVLDINPRETLKKGVGSLYVEMAALPTRGMSIEGSFVRPFTSGTKFRTGDSLMARITPCLENGKGALFLKEHGENPAWGSTEFIVLRPRGPIPVLWPYLLMRDASFREYARQNMTGTSGRQRVSARSIAAYRLPIPPRGIFESFGKMVNGFTHRIEQLRQESETLTQLRDRLLPKLISGEIRVPEAREVAEESVS